MPSTISIRPGRVEDLEQLVAIYNHYVENTLESFEIVPVTLDRARARFGIDTGSSRHRLLVAERDGQIVGFARSGLFRNGPAFETSVETTVFVRPELKGQGIGSALYEELFRMLAGEDVHRAYAGMTPPSDATIRLHTKFGFVRVGVWSEVGRKFDQYLDVVLMEKEM